VRLPAALPVLRPEAGRALGATILVPAVAEKNINTAMDDWPEGRFFHGSEAATRLGQPPEADRPSDGWLSIVVLAVAMRSGSAADSSAPFLTVIV
jgi:hypothetical protein